MIVVRLMGGLGNQMFQYAFGKYLASKNNTQLKLDTELLEDRSRPDEIVTHRKFSLDVFKLNNIQFVSEKERYLFNGSPGDTWIDKIARKLQAYFKGYRLLIQDKNKFSADYLIQKDNTCIAGRWQGEIYFHEISEIIKREFSLKGRYLNEIRVLADEIKNNPAAVCVHVRRGDLVSSPLYKEMIGALDTEYYKKGIEHIKKYVPKPEIYLFSDDLEWCRNNFTNSFYFIGNEYSGEKSTGHMYLMSLCRHFIISNSTFSWWAAWLSDSPGKTVYYPEKWFRDEAYINPVIGAEGWIKL